MRWFRKLLCAIGVHRPNDWARQTFCLNYPSSHPLEFNTKIYSRCVCGAEFERWREDHYLNDDSRVRPLDGIKFLKLEQPK